MTRKMALTFVTRNTIKNPTPTHRLLQFSKELLDEIGNADVMMVSSMLALFSNPFVAMTLTHFDIMGTLK